MSAAAVVIALFINGVQVILPAPAFIEDGTSWVPARVVLERVGCQVSLDQASACLVVVNPSGERHSIAATATTGSVPSDRYVYRYMLENIYISIKTISSLTGCPASWDRVRRRLDLWSAGAETGRAPSTTAGDLLRRGSEAIGDTVTIEGEYLGRPTRGASAAPAPQPPPNEGAYLLRGTGGSVWCSNVPEVTLPFAMGAYGSRGHRLRVTGTLVTDGVRGVRVLVTEASPLSGSAGVMCLLETARPSEHGILRLHLRLAGAGRDGNHGTPVVRASSQNGNNIRNLSVRKTTWMIAARGDNVADAVIECETGGLTAGMYCVSVAPEPGIESYEVTVTLGE